MKLLAILFFLLVAIVFGLLLLAWLTWRAFIAFVAACDHVRGWFPIFIICVLCALKSSGQNILPPTNSETFSVFERAEEVHLPEGNWTNRVFTWSDSDTDIDHYNFFVSRSINPYHWCLLGSVTNRQFTLWLTNGLQIPAVQAVNREGFVSHLCLWTNL